MAAHGLPRILRRCWRAGVVLGGASAGSLYRALVAQGTLPGGYATEDGTGLHYLGTAMHEAVSIRPGKRAWRVGLAPGGGYTEEPIQPRLI